MGPCCSVDKGGDDTRAVGGQDASTENETAAGEAAAFLMSTRDPSSRLQIQVSAEGLRDTDTFSKSDPFCVLYTQEKGQWVEVGRTEVVGNNPSPQFVKSFQVNFFFERLQPMRISCLDADDSAESSKLDLQLQDFLGEAEFMLSELAASSSCKLTLPLTDRQKKAGGTVTLRVEEVNNSNAEATLVLRAEQLDAKDFLGKSDPFVVISRSNEDGSHDKVYRTEVRKKTLNPVWAPIVISFQKLCNGDVDRPLKLECIDWDSDGSHDAIGNLTMSWRALQEAAGKEPITLINSTKNVPAGKLYVVQACLEAKPSFLQYIQQGCELNFMVAIDFTASNGDPADPKSLHYINPAVPSKYQQAILAIGEVLEFFDSDKNFPAYGFGAKYQNEPVQHCFALNGQGFSPEVQGTAGIIQAYHQALSVMTLHGPTLFAPVINAAAAQAAAMHTNISTQQRYLVLTILCDGMILDMEATVDAIVKASSLPLSIFIVGIGDADFTNMHVLDGDNAVLTNRTGQRAARDIVQFVELGVRTGNDVREITAELLEELPGQLTNYMKMNGIAPAPRTFGHQLSKAATILRGDNVAPSAAQHQYPVAIAEDPVPIA